MLTQYLAPIYVPYLPSLVSLVFGVDETGGELTIVNSLLRKPPPTYINECKQIKHVLHNNKERMDLH
jgi:hypothetical protein